VALKESLSNVRDSLDPISQNPGQKRTGSEDLAWLLKVVSPKPESHATERDVEETTEA
jgi:hypothetical protein